MNLVGIDVGGTKCLGVATDTHGKIVHEVRYPTPPATELVSLLSQMFHELDGDSHLGVGLPGLITPDGVVKASPNLTNAHNVPVGPQLREALGVAVHVENDATAAAYGEWKAGAAQNARDAVMVTLGTGIGGGIVMGGVLQRGAHGFAGEIGHMMVERNGIHCVCGRSGCWERYASGSALAYMNDGKSGERTIADARAGDAHAQSVVDTFAEWIAIGLASLTNICDPEIIVLGGGVMDSMSPYMETIEAHFVEALYSPDMRPHPTLALASLGAHAGAIGSALLAADQ